MNNFRKNMKYLNNYEQLNILNDLNRIPYFQNNKNRLSSKSKKNRIILVEKSSPYHFPQYVKLVKKSNDTNGEPSYIQEKSVYSFTNRNVNKLNFQKTLQNRNSIYTQISGNLNRTNNEIDITFNHNLNKNNENSIVNSQEESNEIINNDIARNNRFISISPSQSSKKDNPKREGKNINEIIKVEENIRNNNEDNNNYNKKHKMRYLLSKNFRGKRFFKRKYINNSPKSMVSGFKTNNNKSSSTNENNFMNNLQKNIDNNNYIKNNQEKPINNYNNIESTPGSISNKTDINQYNKKIIRKSIKSLMEEKNIQKTPMITPSIQRKDLKESLTSLNSQNNYNANNIFLNNKNYNNEIKINLNDLIFIEERLNDIIISINSPKNIIEVNSKNEIIEFFSFYNNSSLQNRFPLFFQFQNRIIIKSAFNLNLFMILWLYHLSLNPSILNKTILLLRKIFEVLKINLYLIIRKIEIYYGEEFSQNNGTLFRVFDIYLKNNDIYDLKEKEIIEIINNNCISITTDIENILNYYRVINNQYFSDFRNIYMTISKMNEADLIDYFYNNLYNSNYKENSKIQQKNKENSYKGYLIEKNEDNDDYLDKIILSYKKNKKIPPFIKIKNNKKYTLILDLEDTLISIKIDNEGNVLCHPRPGLISFLNGIKPFYEIISFTKLSKEYSDIITKEIEGNKRLFDYNLYREHCTLIGKEFIKDISRIGRDMSKIVMVDDLDDNLKFYPYNGILIKPYNGESTGNDRVLYELKKMLILFFRLGYEDIRVAIKNYKKEIYDKITLGNIE